MAILQIILALLVLSLLVVVHELGHFLVAKKIGVWAEEFGIGLPPRLWGKKIGETLYSINALPIGGFVKLHGEVGEEEKGIKYPDRAFVNKKPLPRIAVAVAGVVMNVLFAVLCFSAIYAITGIPVANNAEVSVLEVVDEGPADKAGVEKDDVILKINNIPVNASNFRDVLFENAGKEVSLEIKSGEEIITATTVLNSRDNENGILAVQAPPATSGVEYPVWYKAPFEYLKRGISDTVYWGGQTILGFKMLFDDVTSGKAPEGVLGPVGITLTLAEFVKSGLANLLGLTGIISINLALLNIIPFPPLDGSRVVLIIAEQILGKKYVRKHEAQLHLVGMAILLGFIVLMTINEIPRLLQAGSISGFVNSILQ